MMLKGILYHSSVCSVEGHGWKEYVHIAHLKLVVRVTSLQLEMLSIQEGMYILQ